MAKFCTKCGKPLVEGQTCNCGNSVQPKVETLNFEQPSQKDFQQAQQMNQAMGAPMNQQVMNQSHSSANNLFNDCLNIVKNFFKKPVDTIEKNANDNKMVHAIIMVVINALTFGLFAICLMKECVDIIYAYMLSASGLGSYGSLVDTSAIELPYFKTFVLVALVIIVTVALMALLNYLIVNKLFKTQTSYKRMLTVYGFTSIVSSIANLIASLGLLIDVRVGALVLVIGLLLNQHYISVTTPAACVNADKNKIGYAVVVSLVVTLIVVGFIISKMAA